MKVNDSLVNDIVIMELSGKIMGGDDTTYFHGRIHEYLGTNKRRFVIDLKQVTWTNSLGLGMLIAGRAAVTKVEGRIVLANITNIENLLAITGLMRVFDTYDSRQEATDSFSDSAK